MYILLARNVCLKTLRQPEIKRVFQITKRDLNFNPNPKKVSLANRSRQLFAALKQKVNAKKPTFSWQHLFHSMPGQSTQHKLLDGHKSMMTRSEIIKRLFQFVWPKNNSKVKMRVCIAMALLFASKVLNVCVPYVFKEIIDFLNKNTKLKDFGDSAHDKIIVTVVALIVGYGAARAGASLFGELRSAIFATVAQSSVTQLATNVFRHLHQLDLNFHLNRQTGALSKAIDRGTRGISFVLSALVFNVVPTLIEVIMVSGILYHQFGIKYAIVSITCIASYAAFTLAITQWRQKFRHDMNNADNAAGNKAVDSLINYETVKYFNNDEYEVKRYKESLKAYETAAIKTNTSLAVLNFGQNAIFSTGLTAIMVNI